MLDREDIIREISERLKELKPSEMCALFLLAQEGEKVAGTGCEDEWERRAEGLLSRFFQEETTVIGRLEPGCLAVFLNGTLTVNMIEEKTGTLSETFRLAAGQAADSPDGAGRIGVYIFRAGEETFRHACRQAEYALETARQNPNGHFYIYVSPEEEWDPYQKLSSSGRVYAMTDYIDEGVRLLEAEEQLKVIFVSPGFYRRLGMTAGEGWSKIRIHPSDLHRYEQDVRSAVRKKETVESRYRVSREGGEWISCNLKLLRITSAQDRPVILEISHNVTGLEQLRSQNEENKEWIRYMAGQTDCQLWDADLKSRTFRLLYTKNMLDGRQAVYENFPESLIDSGRIHRSSADRFRKFAEGMFSGKPEDSENFVIQYRQSSCYGWASMSYHMLYDEEGHPEKAIGIKEDFSYLPGQPGSPVQRRAMPADLYPHLYCYFQANLTRDTVERLYLEGRDRIGLIRGLTYTELVSRGIGRVFSAGDGKRLQSTFGRRKMLDVFRQGRRWIYDRYRMSDSRGEIQWIALGVNLNQDAETGDICLFAYLSYENQRQRWETESRNAPAAEGIPGVYEAGTEERLVRHLLKQGGQELCALAEIRIEGAGEVFRNDGRKEQDIITALKVFLDTDCVTGRTGESGRLLVFFPHVFSRMLLRRKIENAFSFVRISLDGMEEMNYLRLIAGVACGSREGASLEEMTHITARLCRLHAGEAEDTVVFSEEQGYVWSGTVLGEQEPEKMDVMHPEPITNMGEDEKDVALACQGLMLRADSEETSVSGVLAQIGQFYQADRVYILALTEQGQIVTMLNEWTERGKYSIQQAVSGIRTERFPVLVHYRKNPGPVFLSAKRSLKREQKDEEFWQYAIVPMEKAKDYEPLLCIDNPKKKIEKTALLHYLVPYLSRERRRFSGQSRMISSLARLYAMADLKTCMSVVYSLDSDQNSSLGVLAVDIPEYVSIKAERGYEYGSRFLLRISEVLLDVFGSAMLFHTREAEFVALCTDVTYKTFWNQCARVRQLIGRQYAADFRIGFTWADGVFTARDLVQKARSIMRCSVPADTSGLNDVQENEKDRAGHREEAWLENRDSWRFIIYLQPKIDMCTGSLAGAEALIRILDENGSLLPHCRVIEEMERRGVIQQLDYFVFDSVLYTLQSWREKGYPLIPISSNFSRNTLLSSSALASVLAILSRYPDIPEEMVEMEITETAGDFENHTFEEIIRQFGRYGLQFSLDDFGSSYSNMSMLANLKFHSVKLDRSMIKEITENEVSLIMVRDMVKLCAQRGMICIAEGVETKEQVDALLGAGCRYAQGFYYDRPMPLEAFEKKYFLQTKKGGSSYDTAE